MDFSSLNNTIGPGAPMQLYNSLFPNPADAGMGYLDQIDGKLNPLYSPWMSAGTQALGNMQTQAGQLTGGLPALQEQYNNLMQNPGAMMKQFGAGFQQSPGYQFQVTQALGAANRAASAGGMLGSPQEQQQVGSVVNNLANQDFYNYLNNVKGLYGTGLSGNQNLYGMGLNTLNGIAGMGLNATTNYGDALTNALMSQAQLAYAGQANANQQLGSMIGAGMSAAAMM